MQTDSLEERLFARAALLRGEERQDLLNRECAHNPQLRARVEELLAAHETPGEFMSREEAATVFAELDQPAGSRIGRYKIREKIGEGGCGVVYAAEQTEPIRRRVALKVIKLGMDTRQVIARFEAERQALALMDHPNIAKVLDAGATETGRPYFVMEYVRGISITEYCERNRLPTRERLDLFVLVAHAIQHAHQKGLIHRDIKPSNVLVTMHDGTPVPKVIDFGIAKATEGRLTDTTLYTQLHQVLGTPAYMSPEQAEMSGIDVDTRSDIYSLGVLLYQLLTGTTPFDSQELISAGFDGMREIIREREPPRPSTRLIRGSPGEPKGRDAASPRLEQVEGDLDWIVMKCLEKDRTRRYETANGLAQDIKRHLHDEPVLARPPSRAYRFTKMVRRNTGAFVAAGLVVLALLAGLVVSLSQMTRARKAEHAAEAEADRSRQAEILAQQQRNRAEASLYAADMNVVQQALEQHNLRLARERLRAHVPKPGHPDLRGWEWWHFDQLARGDEVLRLPTAHRAVAVKRSATLGGMVIGLEDGTVNLLNARNEQVALLRNPGGLSAMAIDDSNGTLAAQSADGIVRIWKPSGAGGLALDKTLRVDGPLRAIQASRQLLAVAAQVGGRWEIPGSDQGTIAIWNYETGERRGLIDSGDLAAFASDGRTLLTGSWKETLKVWNVADWTIRRSVPVGGRALHLALSSASGTAMVSTHRGSFLWNLSSEEPLWPITVGAPGLRTVQADFSPDGSRLASAYSDGTIGLFDSAERREMARLQGAETDAQALTFALDGQRLVSADRLTNMLRVFPPMPSAPRELRIAMLSAPVFGRAGGLVAVGEQSEGGFQCAIQNLHDGTKRVLAGEPNPLAFQENDSVLVTAMAGVPFPLGSGPLKGLTYWNLRDGTRRSVLLETTNLIACAVVLSADGKMFAAGDLLGTVRVWDASSGRLLHTLPASTGQVWNLVFSADGRRLGVGIIDDVAIWNLGMEKRILEMPAHGMPLAISPDGKTVALSTDTEIRLIDLDTRAERILTGHRDRLYGLAFSPDGRTLASAAEELKLWSLAAGREVARLNLGDTVMYAGFSPEGRMFLGGTVGQGIVWMTDRP